MENIEFPKKKKRIKRLVRVILAIILCCLLIVVLFCNRKESKMAVFESREQLGEWLVAGDYGAAPSRFHAPLGKHPDIEADVSYLVPLIKEHGVPTIVCDDDSFSYTDEFLTLNPYAKSDSREPQMMFNVTLNGYDYTVYATYITEGVRSMYENSDEYISGSEKEKRIFFYNFLETYLGLACSKEITYDEKVYTFYESVYYKFAPKSIFTGKGVLDYILWEFIYEDVIYGIAFEPGEDKENYEVLTAQIPQLIPQVISYDDFISEVDINIEVLVALPVNGGKGGAYYE